jgi:hypothetical protein
MMLGIDIFLFGMWYEMPGIGTYTNAMVFANTYERGVGGFLITLGLSLGLDSVILIFFDELF